MPSLTRDLLTVPDGNMAKSDFERHVMWTTGMHYRVVIQTRLTGAQAQCTAVSCSNFALCIICGHINDFPSGWGNCKCRLDSVVKQC